VVAEAERGREPILRIARRGSCYVAAKLPSMNEESGGDRVLWDINAVPSLDWHVLNEETQVASKDGQVVAIAYAVAASDSAGQTWLEFCWIPVDEPTLADVHFGVAPGAGRAWDTRWERTRKATEWEYARRHLGAAGKE
jgi:hypothetical protein